MTFNINPIIILLMALALPACAVLESSFEFESVHVYTKEVYFQHLTAVVDDNQLVISGELKHSQTTVLPDGHVDVAVFSPEGNLVSETTATYTANTSVRNIRSALKLKGNRFRATLDRVPPSGSLIKVAFHPKTNESNAKSDHELNITR